jgi:hypothetical protein
MSDKEKKVFKVDQLSKKNFKKPLPILLHLKKITVRAFHKNSYDKLKMK